MGTKEISGSSATKRTKDHIVAVGFEPLDHICSVRLVKIEGYMLVAVYIQEGSHCMRNIVVCQRKYIGDINMSAASGKLLHLMLGNTYLLEDPVDMFLRKTRPDLVRTTLRP